MPSLILRKDLDIVLGEMLRVVQQGAVKVRKKSPWSVNGRLRTDQHAQHTNKQPDEGRCRVQPLHAPNALPKHRGLGKTGTN